MNDRKIKGKPHIEAKQWADMLKVDYEKLSDKIYYFAIWEDTPQHNDFWEDEVIRLSEKGL